MDFSSWTSDSLLGLGVNWKADENEQRCLDTLPGYEPQLGSSRTELSTRKWLDCLRETNGEL